MQNFPALLVSRLTGAPEKRGASPVGRLSWGQVGTAVAVHAPGPLLDTGRELDFAIEGPGFFCLETPQGEAYTRCGTFLWDAEGFLVTPQGYYVQGREGRIRKENFAGPASFLVARFAFPQNLQRAEDNLFFATPAAGLRELGEGRVLQGYLEQANVGLASEMVNFLAAFQAYQANQRALLAEDEVMARTMTVGSVR